MPFLIDGHNLIGHMPNLSLDDPDDERKLIELLRAYLTRVKKKGTVIFDKGLPGGAAKWSSGDLDVRFAPHPKTADELIIERLRKDKNPRGLAVVSSDQQVGFYAKHAGANIIKAADFARLVIAPPPDQPTPKETGLSANEVAEWEQEFLKGRE